LIRRIIWRGVAAAEEGVSLSARTVRGRADMFCGSMEQAYATLVAVAVCELRDAD